jgi:cytoskeleton protein RodZ
VAGIGQQLETTRRMQNLSIEQVAADTRISARFIQALEDEQFDVLPAPVYVRGFLRSYANYLRMDPQPLLDELSRYEEADGYVVRGPAPWRGPGIGTRQTQRNPSSDPFRPRPPGPAPREQAAGVAPLAPVASPGNGNGADNAEWQPELEDPVAFEEAEAYSNDEPAFEDYQYQDEPAWVSRERATQGVLLERPVPLRDGSGPPRLGIAVAALALFGAVAVGAFFLLRGSDDGDVAAGSGDGSETPTVQQTPAGIVEVRTPTPALTANTTGTPATATNTTPTAEGTGTPGAGATVTATSTTSAATATPAQQQAEDPTPVPTLAPQPTATSVPFVPTATPEPPTATPTPEPPTPTPTPPIVHPLGTSLCGSGVNPCGDPPYVVICGPNGWFIDPAGSYVNSGWPVSSASRIGEASSAC